MIALRKEPRASEQLDKKVKNLSGRTDTFVLDFVNGNEEIQRSFQPYFEATTVADTADPQQLYDLAHKLEAAQVLWKSEMNRHRNPGVDRFKALDEAPREELKNALGAFVRLYAFLSQVMPFTDPDLEKLYTFARFFETDPKKDPRRLDGDVALKYYRLDKLSEGSIVLRIAEPGVVYGASEVGTKKAGDEAQLSEIIEVLNERFSTEFNQADQILFDQFIAAAMLDDEVVQRAKANPFDNFALAMKDKVEGLRVDRMDQNQEIVSRYLNDSQFQDLAFRLLVRRTYDEIRGGKNEANV